MSWDHERIAHYATALSALLSAGGLFMTGFQLKRNANELKRNTRETHRKGYLETLKHWHELQRLMITENALKDLREWDSSKGALTSQQVNFINAHIAFFESLFLTDQMKPFPDRPEVSWEGHILGTMKRAAYSTVWRAETGNRVSPDYAKSFVEYLNELLIRNPQPSATPRPPSS